MQPIQIPTVQVGLEASIQKALQSAGKGAQVNLGTSAKQINALSQPLGRITGQADEFTKSMSAANARVLAFGASVGIINAVSNAFAGLIKSTIEVEKSLTEINTVLNTSQDGLQKFGDRLFQVAKNTGQSFDVVAKGALELARQGLSTEETLKRINDALILTRLSGLDSAQSVEGLTAAFNSFKDTGITVSEILNKLVVVSQKYAVSERDLIEGLKRSASVADQAGVSFDELVGIITAVQERTARGGAVIGNAFKTIFTRVQRTDSLQALQDIGVAVTDIEGKILPATKLLENLAQRIEGLNQIELAEITEKIGGGFQIANLIAALKDLSKEQSVYGGAVQASLNAANEAYQKNAALNETLASLINKVSVSAQQLGKTLGEIGISDSLKGVLSFFNNLLESIQKVLGEESGLSTVFKGLVKGIGNVIAGPGLALFAAIIAKLSKDLVQFGFQSLKAFFGIGEAAKGVKAVQDSINVALSKNSQLQQQLFQLEGNRAAQLSLITKALVEQEAVIRRSASISQTLAAPLYGAGVRSTGQGLRIPPKAAGGYMPAVAGETSDIRRGVGGARSSDRPVVIPNFAFGGGKRGPIVANTSEYIVPNFAGGSGSAIFNRDMIRSMGLPSGAEKINAAGGFIPNFASLETQSTKVLEKYAAGIGRDITSEKQNAARAILQQRKGSKLPLNKLTKINPGGSDFGMIVGQRGASNQVSRFADEIGRISTTQTENSRYLIDVPIYRIQDDKLKFKESKTINEQISNISAKTALKMAKDLSGGQLPNPDNIQLIKSLLNPGSLAGTAGAIFEAGIAGILKGDDFKDYTTINRNSLIDFKPYGRIKELFNVPQQKASKGLEAKATDGKDLISSAAGKFLKNAKGLAAFSSRRASKGYIPNFANPLKEAIGREMSAGVSASQIYVDQNSSLKNSMNPMGLMVANRRDEPGGAMQGISRAKREGANPMFYGAAGGFIPNYAPQLGQVTRPDLGRIRNLDNQEIDNFNTSLKQISDQLRKGTISFADANLKVAQLAQSTGSTQAQVKKLTAVGGNLITAYNNELTARNQKAQQLKQDRAENRNQTPPPKGGRDMLGTIFAVQAGLSLLTGATSDASSTVIKFANQLSSSAGSITTAFFAAEGIKNIVPETNRLSKVFGGLAKAGIITTVAIEAFNIIKFSIDELSGKNKEAALSTAAFNDAVKAAGISLGSLSELDQLSRINKAKDIIYNIQGKQVGRVGSEQTQRQIAEFSLLSGITDQNQIEEILKRRKALTEKTRTIINAESGTQFEEVTKTIDEEKVGEALSRELADPKVQEYIAGQRKKAADEAEREAKATAQIQAVEQVNLQYAKDQLTNALELTVARQRGFDSLDKQLLLNELNNELSEEEVASLKRQIEQRDLNRDLADQTKGLLIDQINSIDGIVAKEEGKKKNSSRTQQINR
jgi:TP901 family phage tail tape measure protein